MYTSDALAKLYYAHNSATGKYEGMALEILDQLALEAGFTYEVHDIGGPGQCRMGFSGTCPKVGECPL